MEAFVKMAAEKLGIDEGIAKSGTGAVVKLVQSQLGGEQSGKLFEQLGGVGDLLSGGQDSADSGGGSMLGGMMQMAGSLAGGGAGKALELTGALKNAGLDPEQSTSLVTMFIGYVKEKAGMEWLGTLLDKFPELKQFANIS